MINQQQNNALSRQQAADTSVYYPAYGEAGEDVQELGSYLSSIFRHKWIMLLITTLVFAAGMLYTFTRRPVYESVAKIVVVTNRDAAPVSSEGIPIIQDLQALRARRSVDTQIEVILSDNVLEDAFNQLDPKLKRAGFGNDSLPDWAYKVTGKKDTDIISVAAKAYTREAAAALANSIVETYFERDLKQSTRTTRQAREYAESDMETVGRKLTQANIRLSQYKKQSGLFAPDTQLTKTADQMAQLSLELHNAKAEIAALRRETETIARELAREETDVVANSTITINPEFSAARAKIDALNSERVELLQEFTPESREVRSLDERIKAEEKRLKSVATTIVGSKVHSRNPTRDILLTKYATNTAAVSAANARLAALEKEYQSRQANAMNLPERERNLAELTQQVAILQRRYDMLANSYFNLLLSEQAALPAGVLVSEARTPSNAAYPDKKTSLAFFLVLGAILAVVAAIVIDRSDNRLHDQSHIEQKYGLTTLSIVPTMTDESPRLFINGYNNAFLLESFRILRNNIRFSDVDRKMNILAITSPGRSEGKSTTTINLAVTMGLEGKRVLLVDGDVRKPSLHKLLAVPRNRGLTTVLQGTSTLEQSIVSSSIKNVSCLPAGPNCDTCSDMLNSHTAQKMFQWMAEKYDIVLVDCPPATGLSDVQALSTLADGVVLVVSASKTMKPQLDATLRMLSQARAPLIGVVMNHMDMRLNKHYYYYGDDIEEDSQ